jgi:hypothetical protein
VVWIIDRLDVGKPANQVGWLTAGLDPTRLETALINGNLNLCACRGPWVTRANLRGRLAIADTTPAQAHPVAKGCPVYYLSVRGRPFPSRCVQEDPDVGRDWERLLMTDHQRTAVAIRETLKEGDVNANRSPCVKPAVSWAHRPLACWSMPSPVLSRAVSPTSPGSTEQHRTPDPLWSHTIVPSCPLAGSARRPLGYRAPFAGGFERGLWPSCRRV